jgi:beta-phosphoglucomutase-like phosphatase (HAD superfamily)
MHLVMFDIDGTLTETMKVDEECFVRSFDDVFGFTDLMTIRQPRQTTRRTGNQL